MTDRLKQIWGEFQGRTSARLTSVDIDGVQRPMREQRMEREAAPEMSLEAGRADESDAVKAAFTALHADIMAKAKRGGRKSRRGEPQAHFAADPYAAAHSPIDEQLFADLKSTETRTRRGGSDYLSYAKSQQDAWKGRRKKFLGIF